MESFLVSQGLRFSLPAGLSSDPNALLDILSNHSWSSLSQSAHSILKEKFLPKFPKNSAEEQEKTLSQLFSGENFCFSNPLEKFVELLWEGWLKPNVPPLLDLQKSTQKALKRKYMLEYHHKLLKDIVISRQALIDTALQLGPNQPIRMRMKYPQSKNSKHPYQFEDRIKRRYQHELQSIKKEAGDDRSGFSSDDEQYLGIQDGGVNRRVKKDGPQTLYVGHERLGVVNTFTEKNGLDRDPPYEITDEMYKNMLRKFRKNRKKNSRAYEFDAVDVSLADVVRRVKGDSADRKLRIEMKKASELEKAQGSAEGNEDSTSDDEDPENDQSSSTDSDLDESSAVSDEDFAKDNEESETHACFFSLIRDVICSFEDQTATVANLRSSIRSWQETDVAAANEWFTLIPDGKWDGHLSSVLAFLAGHSNLLSATFAPYIQWQPATKTYQWTAAVSDNDAVLSGLNEIWNSSLETKHGSNTDVSQPSVLTVKEYLRDFQEQERRRFDNPTRAFTYQLRARSFTVGPVAEPVREAGKMRGQCILRKDRPFSVGFLTLVKDAVARLPQGQGTKGEIQELLIQSQFITPQPEDKVNLSNLISSALDKIQFEPDPCCKYDSTTKAWQYLHKGRSESEMERMHILCKDMPHQSRVPGSKRRKTDVESQDPRTVPTASGFSGTYCSFGGSPMQLVNPAQVSGKVMPASSVLSPAPSPSPARTARPMEVQLVSTPRVAPPTKNQNLPMPSVSSSMSGMARLRHPIQRPAPVVDVIQTSSPRLSFATKTVSQSIIRPSPPRMPVPAARPTQIVPQLTAPTASSVLRPVRGTTIVVQAADGTRRQVTLPPGFQATAENIRSLAQAIQRPQGNPQPRQATPIIRTTTQSSVRMRGPSQP